MPDRPVAEAAGRGERAHASLKVEQTPAFMTAFCRSQYPASAAGRSQGAPGDQPGLRPHQLPAGGIRRQRQCRHRHLSAEHLELCQGYSRLPARSRTGAQAAGRQAASRAEHLDPPVRQPAQPQPEPRRPTAPGRPGGGRDQGQHPRHRMGRVDPSRQERRTRPAVHGLGRRQRRSGQLPHSAPAAPASSRGSTSRAIATPAWTS